MKQSIIMIIDDEMQLRKMIRTFLEKDGYKVVEATDGMHALSLLEKTSPDLLIIDIMMPFMDGFTFAKELKKRLSVPFIFLSAKGEKWDKVKGLKLGGDDYIAKPFFPAELLARVESVLRRTYDTLTEPNLHHIGPLQINYDSYQVKLNNISLTLTRKEFGLLDILVKNPGRVYSREELLFLVWGNGHHSSERTVDTHIKTLRLKLGKYGKLIETVWGIGYKFEVKDEKSLIN